MKYIMNNVNCSLNSRIFDLYFTDLMCTEEGDPCIFPFKWKGVQYQNCTLAGDSEKTWCSTANDDNGEVISGSWGDCFPCSSGKFDWNYSLIYSILSVVYSDGKLE